MQQQKNEINEKEAYLRKLKNDLEEKNVTFNGYKKIGFHIIILEWKFYRGTVTSKKWECNFIKVFYFIYKA